MLGRQLARRGFLGLLQLFQSRFLGRRIVAIGTGVLGFRRRLDPKLTIIRVGEFSLPIDLIGFVQPRRDIDRFELATAAAGLHRSLGGLAHALHLRLLGSLQAMFDHHLELELTDPQLVAMGQDFRLVARQTVLVHERTVAAVQILSQHAIVSDYQNAMLPAHRFAFGSQLTRIAPPDQKLFATDGNLHAGMTSRRNLQFYVHQMPSLSPIDPPYHGTSTATTVSHCKKNK